MRYFFIFFSKCNVFRLPLVQTQTEHGNFHFQFIFEWWIMHPRESLLSQQVRRIQIIQRETCFALKPPARLLLCTIHWPSGCLCRQRSDRSSPSPASWGAHTPCPSGSVLWSVSAKTNTDDTAMVKRSPVMQRKGEKRSSTIFLKYPMCISASSWHSTAFWETTWCTDSRPHLTATLVKIASLFSFSRHNKTTQPFGVVSQSVYIKRLTGRMDCELLGKIGLCTVGREFILLLTEFVESVLGTFLFKLKRQVHDFT